MLSAEEYFFKVGTYFSFLTVDQNYKLSKQKFNGNVFYEIEFKSAEKIISISYENISDYQLIMVFRLNNGVRPHFEDKINSFRLNLLTKMIFPKVNFFQITANREYFNECYAENKFDRELLKSAIDLRLCLSYFDEYVKSNNF